MGLAQYMEWIYEFCLVVLGCGFPDSKVHGANMGPNWVLWAPNGTHVGPMNLANWDWLVLSIPFRTTSMSLEQLVYLPNDSEATLNNMGK